VHGVRPDAGATSGKEANDMAIATMQKSQAQSNYYSGEFDPGAGSRPYPNGVAIFNNQIFVVGGGNVGPGDLGQTTVALPSVENIRTLPTANWSSTGQFPMTNGAPRVDGRCALVALGSDLFLFAAGGQGPFASQYSLQGESGPVWGQAMFLSDMNGRAVTGISDVDAKAFGTTGILVGSARVDGTSGDVTYLSYYDTRDIDAETHSWEARYSIYVTPQTLSVSGVTVSGPGANLSLDWFSTSVNTQLQYYVAAFMTPDTSDGALSALYSFPFSVDSDGAVTGVQGPSLWKVPAGNGTNGAVVRDPAGRLNLYYFNGVDNLMQIAYMDTYAFTPGQTPSYQASGHKVTNDNIAPTPIYWIGPYTANQAPVYELLFYASDLRAQISTFGTAEILPNFTTYSPVPATRFVIEGIMDGPIPFPNVNIQSASHEVYDAATVTYSSDKSQQVQHEQSFSWTVGLQSQGSAGKGLGPAWDISVNGGTGSQQGQESGTVLANPQQKTSQVLGGTKTIDPRGSLYADQVEMVVTGYKFTDANGNVITDPTIATAGQAPKFFSVAASFVGGTSPDFLPYAVTPGDLSSYTPEAINARMTSLGYAGGNYFGDVIVPNAYAFQGGQKALECEWSSSGSRVNPSFEAMISSFTERGWTFDSSVYLGLSGGEGVELFGAGVSETFSVMAGFTVSLSGSDTATNGSSWGICLEAGWAGPPPSTSPQAISNYTFQIVFLPPPDGTSLPANYWAKELYDYAPKVSGQMLNPDTVDPNSACWRIMFVVISYTSNDGKTTYSYDRSLGQL
jgi:hypothetical protein